MRNGAQLNPELLKLMVKAGDAGGVKVRYWPVWMASDQEIYLDTETTSEPWALGHGEWVVKLKGKSGGQAVSHCALLPILPGSCVGPEFQR